MNASTSLARNIFLWPTPTISGASLRAPTITSGLSWNITAIAYCPFSLFVVAMVAFRGSRTRLYSSSSRWAITSVSVSLLNLCPLAESPFFRGI